MFGNPFTSVLRTIRQKFGLASCDSPDSALLDRFASSKDEAAFAAIVERHGAMVWGTCRRVAGDTHAEDAFQATWLVLARQAGSLRDGVALPCWLHRVAFRLSLSARARPSALLQESPAGSPGPEDEAARRETRAVVDEEVERLPEKYRLPVVLCFFEGRTHAEVAAELGWPIGTVAGRLARAKDLLHARLTRRGVAPAAWPLPVAAAVPVVARVADTQAASLASAFLASGLRGRLLAASALVLLPALAALAFLAAPTAGRPKGRVVSDPSPEPPPPVGQIIPRNRIMHRDAVTCVAVSRDGRILASGGDTSVKLWDARTCKELVTFSGHAGGVRSVAFSRDGKVLASASHDKTVNLWDVKTHQLLHTLEGHGGEVCSVSFSPDGDKVASASKDKTVKVWEVKTGKLLTTLAGHAGELRCVAYAPDGKTIASAGVDRTVRLWGPETGKAMVILTGPESEISSIAFSPDGTKLVSGILDCRVKVWDTKSGKELAWLRYEDGTGSDDIVHAVAFSPDGRTLAVGHNGGTIRLWDVETKKRLNTLRGGHLSGIIDSNVLSLAFFPDGKTLASASSDRTVKLWDVKSGKEQGATVRSWDYVPSVVPSPDGKTIAKVEASPLGDVEVRAADSRKVLHHFSLERASSIAYSPDGTTLAAGGARVVKLWDVKTGTVLHTLQVSDKSEWIGDVRSVAFSPDGKTLAAGRADKLVTVWEVKSGKELHTLRGHTAPVLAVAFSPNGKTLASGSNDTAYDSGRGDNAIKLWEMNTGRLLHTLDQAAPVYALAFSPDGKTLASGSGYRAHPFDTAIRLWDLETYKLRAALRGHVRPVRAVAFTPDGKTLASQSEYGGPLSWDVSDSE